MYSKNLSRVKMEEIHSRAIEINWIIRKPFSITPQKRKFKNLFESYANKLKASLLSILNII